MPSEDVDTIGDAGAVNVVYGSAVGFTTDGNQLWHQDIANIEGVCEVGDRFGCELASSYRVRLPLFKDGFETGNTSNWSAEVP